jgi:hypothetical protein
VKKSYLGDGVYIEWTGWDFVLKTQRENGEHSIHLEPFQINALNNFVLACAAEVTK